MEGVAADVPGDAGDEEFGGHWLYGEDGLFYEIIVNVCRMQQDEEEREEVDVDVVDGGAGSDFIRCCSYKSTFCPSITTFMVAQMLLEVTYNRYNAF